MPSRSRQKSNDQINLHLPIEIENSYCMQFFLQRGTGIEHILHVKPMQYMYVQLIK